MMKIHNPIFFESVAKKVIEIQKNGSIERYEVLIQKFDTTSYAVGR